MMNKGFEVIEAHWLFGLSAEQIKVIIHKQSIIHSFVEFIDGSIKAQLSSPDMRIPISYSLSYPRRTQIITPPYFDILIMSGLDFSPVELDWDKSPRKDINKYECLRIAYQCLSEGGNIAAIVNAANEIAVDLFYNDKIGFLDIPKLIYHSIDRIDYIKEPSLSELFETDQAVRQLLQNKFQ